MSNCKACNASFTPRINKFNGEEEELCSICLMEARFIANDIESEIDDNNSDELLDALDMSLDDVYSRGG